MCERRKTEYYSVLVASSVPSSGSTGLQRGWPRSLVATIRPIAACVAPTARDHWWMGLDLPETRFADKLGQSIFRFSKARESAHHQSNVHRVNRGESVDHRNVDKGRAFSGSVDENQWSPRCRRLFAAACTWAEFLIFSCFLLFPEDRLSWVKRPGRHVLSFPSGTVAKLVLLFIASK